MFVPIPVATLYAGILGLMLILHSIRTVKQRFKQKVFVGDDANEEMTRQMRVMANFCEYAPTFMILLALVEASGAHKSALHVFGIVFVAGRIVHALGLGRAINESKGRTIGTLMTYLSIVGASFYALYFGLRAL